MQEGRNLGQLDLSFISPMKKLIASKLSYGLGLAFGHRCLGNIASESHKVRSGFKYEKI